MTKKLISSLILLFLVQLLIAQESEWHWQNPYPLPFMQKLHNTVDGRVLIQHDNDQFYQINDDDTFTKLDMNLPFWNYYSGQAQLQVLSETKWIIFAPYVIYITEDGGNTYEEFTSELNWQYSNPQFIDELNGIVLRVKGNTRQMVRTEDGGKTWEKILSGPFPQSVEMVSKDVLYCITSGSNRKIVKTVDGGATWVEKGECPNCDIIRKVNDNLLISDTPFLYISEDDGKSLQEVLFLYDVYVTDQFNNSISIQGDVILATNSKLLFKSMDGGYTWESIDSDLLHVSLFNGMFKNNDHYYMRYFTPQSGIIKLNVETGEFKPILGDPINNIVQFQKLDSESLVFSSFTEFTGRYRIYSSEDNGYTWKKYFVKLPDNRKFAHEPLQIKSDSTLYVPYQDSIYYYDNFTEEYERKIGIDTIKFDGYSSFPIRVLDNGIGYLLRRKQQEFLYTQDSFKTYTKVKHEGKRFDALYPRSDNSFWMLGQTPDDYNKYNACIVDKTEIDTCFYFSEDVRSRNMLGDDLLLGIPGYPAGILINAETGVEPFCPILPGKVLSIISEDKMMIQNQNLLYIANPQTCEIIEYVDIEYNNYLQSKYINFKFVELDNGDILGYSPEGYMIRRTDNFLDTLLYNASKEVEYEATTQEYQFIVYPNPTSDWLQVKDMPYGVECRIIDLKGQEHMRGKQSLIYTGQYPSGTYFIQFFQDGKLIESQKIVIQ